MKYLVKIIWPCAGWGVGVYHLDEKNTYRRMRGENILQPDRKGEDDVCHKGVRWNVPDVQVSTGSRAKDMVLERHM